MPAQRETPLLRIEKIQKSFPGVRALQGVTFELRAGEVVALMGENGAGKSTLIKILSGAQTADAGVIEIDGRVVQITSPSSARRLGIGVVHQEFNLVPGLTASDNIFLGQELSWFALISAKRETERARQLFEDVGVPISPTVRCRDLSVAQQQIVEIAKGLAMNARIFVMDEPSAALSSREVERLFAVIRELISRGIGIIYVSHRLSEIFEIAQRVVVLRDGQHIITNEVSKMTRDSLIEHMVGRSLEDEFPPRVTVSSACHLNQENDTSELVNIGEPRLVVTKLRRGNVVRDVSFDVRGGEIVALAGLVGSGRTETARLIFAADRLDSGAIWLDGQRLRLRNPRNAIAAGICLLTEDRKSHGLVLGLNVQHNFGLPNLRRFCRWNMIHGRWESSAFDRYTRQLGIKSSGRNQITATLSGGNQQKLVLAKWLERNAEVLLFDEPTRGIDVGAKYEIYLLMNQLAAQGKAILMISSELPEVLGMADRILVMHEGKVTGELTDVENTTQQDIMQLAVQ